MRRLIRIDRNGTKYWGDDTCQRCGGLGESEAWADTGRVCYECGGTGTSKMRIEKEYDPTYVAQLEARRAKRHAKWEADHAEELAAQKREAEEREAASRAEEERKAEEERREAERKARSEYLGAEGEKITVTAVYEASPHFDRPSFRGYGKERVYLHQFRAGAALLVWKTGTYPAALPKAGEAVTLTGTVKGHGEYKGEKQTMLIRCKISA